MIEKYSYVSLYTYLQTLQNSAKFLIGSQVSITFKPKGCFSGFVITGQSVNHSLELKRLLTINRDLRMYNLKRLGKVKETTGLSRSTIYALMATGKFPKPVKISARCVAWQETEINNWIQSRIDSSSASN